MDEDEEDGKDRRPLDINLGVQIREMYTVPSVTHIRKLTKYR